MENPKFEVGQSVEVESWLNRKESYKPAVIRHVHATYSYDVVVEGSLIATTYSEDRIRPPKPSPEEAWEKAAMLIGQRAYIKGKPSTVYPFNENFNRETRHQVYQILGSASIKITDEVKQDVRRLIEVSETLG